MSATRSISPYHSNSILHIKTFERDCVNHDRVRYQFDGNQGLLSLSYSIRAHVGIKAKMNMAFHSSLQPPDSAFPSDSSPGSWKVWIGGIMITIVLSFWRNKWGSLLKFARKVETAKKTVEHVVDIVEKVAEEAEKVAEEVADHLPEGGRLRKAAIFVENVAKETAKDVHLVEDFIDKVEEVDSLIDTLINDKQTTKTRDDDKSS